MATFNFINNPIKQVESLSKAVTYTANKNKTKNEEYNSPDSQKRLLEYVEDEKKTRNEQFLTSTYKTYKEESDEDKEYFVTGIGCTGDDAYEVMTACQKASTKSVKNIAYHAVQSFLESPDELSPKTAHEIGVRLARELWGDEFVVLVATHQNTKHIHNHFVICSTSPYTGYRFNKCDKTRDEARAYSDKLCREYGLHVLDNQKGNHFYKSKSKGETFAEKRGQPTYRNILKQDIDDTVKIAYSWNDFVNLMKKKGYTFRFGKTITVHTPYSERGIRLSEKLGKDYTYDTIRKRIACKTPDEEAERTRIRSATHTLPKKKYTGHKKPKGIRSGLTIHYYRMCYHLGIVPSVRTKKKKTRVSPHLWKEIKQFRKYQAEMNLLSVNHIRTASQLRQYKESNVLRHDELDGQRQLIRNKLRRCTNAVDEEMLRNKLSKLNSEMRRLRKEVTLCDDILTNSEHVATVNNEYVGAEYTQLKTSDKERKSNERKIEI